MQRGRQDELDTLEPVHDRDRLRLHLHLIVDEVIGKVSVEIKVVRISTGNTK